MKAMKQFRDARGGWKIMVDYVFSNANLNVTIEITRRKKKNAEELEMRKWKIWGTGSSSLKQDPFTGRRFFFFCFLFPPFTRKMWPMEDGQWRVRERERERVWFYCCSWRCFSNLCTWNSWQLLSWWRPWTPGMKSDYELSMMSFSEQLKYTFLMHFLHNETHLSTRDEAGL